MPVTRGVRVKVAFEADDPEYEPRIATPQRRFYKDMDLPVLDESSEVISITCGILQAKLHKQRFICPGINRDCIEYEGKLLTPKTFYIMADKGSLKDWKNAIRINGKKIRRYIDSGVLDFYNHKELCTGRCKSRLGKSNSILNFDPSLLNSISSPLPTPISTPSTSKKKESTAQNADSGFNSSNESIVTDSFGEPKDIKPTAEQLSMMMLQTTSGQLSPSSSSSEQHLVHPIKLVSFKDLQSEEGEDEDQLFWRAIVQLGLIDEFFREIKSILDVLKIGMIKNFVKLDDAKKASAIVTELGMKEKLDMRLCAHKFEFDRQRDRLEKEMEQLKKKVTEYEQKKEILKLKSDCYDQLLAKQTRADESPQHSFTFETSSGSTMVLQQAETSDAEDRSRSVSPVPGSHRESLSLIKKQRDMLVSKKRKAESGAEIPTKFTIETPHGPTTVLLSQQDPDSESSRTTSPFPALSQDSSAISQSQESSNETYGESLSQESGSI